MQGAAAGLAQSALSCRGCFESLLAVLALGSLFAWPLHALRFLHSAAYFTVGFGPTGRSSLGRLAWLGMAWLSSLRLSALGPTLGSRSRGRLSGAAAGALRRQPAGDLGALLRLCVLPQQNARAIFSLQDLQTELRQKLFPGPTAPLGEAVPSRLRVSVTL